ncbi:hypothetical protein Tco_0114732 [Tanacetum coccineum]
MAREAHAERARGKGRKFGGEAAELIPFASWAQSSAVFPGQIKDLGLLCYAPQYTIAYSNWDYFKLALR